MNVRLLLALDRRFVRVDGELFTTGAIGAESGSRYLSSFEWVTVMGRIGDIAEADRGDLTKVGLPGIDYTLLPNIASTSGLLRLPALRRRIAEKVSAADAVIGRLPSWNGLEACRMADKLGVPWAVELGGCVWDALWNHGTVRGRLSAPVAWALTRKTVRNAKYVSYVTESFLQERYPAKEAVTLVCSNVEIDRPSPLTLEMRLAKIREPASKTIFGTIASLHNDAKGIQHALKALASVSQQLGNFEYRVLGQGDPARWQRMADSLGLKDRVVFSGVRKPGQPVLDWLDAIDVYLQPSLQEGLPRAVIEAMSRGCPVIGSTAGGIPELVDAVDLHRPGDVHRLGTLLVGSLSRDWREARALRNWTESGKYERSVLAPRREAFWSRFAINSRA